MDPNHNQGPQSQQADSRKYLVGSIRADKALAGPCPFAQTLFAYSYAYGREVVAVLTCNRWGCYKCGPRKAKRLAYRIESAVPNKLITLTVDAKRYTDGREAYDATRRQLSDLSKLIKKKVGSFEYFRVLEITKLGMPHYHLMARCPYIPQRIISELWAGLVGAPIVDIRQIRKINNTFAYVVKYLCKQTAIPWTNRRTSWSRGFFPKEAKYQPVPLRLIDCEMIPNHPQCTLRERYPNHILEQFSPSLFILREPDDEEELTHIPEGEGTKDDFPGSQNASRRYEPRPADRETTQ